MSEQKAMSVTEDPIYQALMSYKTAIASVIPKHLTAERMLRISYQMIHRTPRLRECSINSLVNGIIEISMLGLDIGRTAHLVPFKREAVVIVDYKGFIDLAHRSGQINSLPFKAVYENDLFDYEEGTTRFIKHKPAATDRGDLVAAYAICNFKHGGYDFEVVHPVDIAAIKKSAPGAKSSDSPWNNPDQEWTMWCKSAVRRLSKRIPQSPELRRAVELEDLVEAGLKQNISHITEDIIDMDPLPPKKEQKTPESKKGDISQKINDIKNQTGATPSTGQELSDEANIAQFSGLRTPGILEWEKKNRDRIPLLSHEVQVAWVNKFQTVIHRAYPAWLKEQMNEESKEGEEIPPDLTIEDIDFARAMAGYEEELGKPVIMLVLARHKLKTVVDIKPEQRETIKKELGEELDKKNE